MMSHVTVILPGDVIAAGNIIQLSDDFEFDIGIYFVETCNIEREAARDLQEFGHFRCIK